MWHNHLEEAKVQLSLMHVCLFDNTCLYPGLFNQAWKVQLGLDQQQVSKCLLYGNSMPLHVFLTVGHCKTIKSNLSIFEICNKRVTVVDVILGRKKTTMLDVLSINGSF